MSERFRHGLHVVRDTPAATGAGRLLRIADGPPSLRLCQQSVVLTIGGWLTADTCGRLRLFLWSFTVDGGPRELVLDLSEVCAVDEDGMAPIYEADEAMRQRQATLRLGRPSTAVTDFLGDVRGGQVLASGSPPATASPDPSGQPASPTPDDGPSRAGRD